MNPMFNKNSTAFFFIPKPMIWIEILIACIVFKKPVQKITQYFLLHQIPDKGKQGIVALH